MNKFIVSASLFAVGAAGLKGAYAPGLTRQQTAKPWSISAALRGFYDDNYTTRPDSATGKEESLGFEFSPTVAVNYSGAQTYIGASYTYSLKYYFDDLREDDPIDNTHEFNLKLDHQFSQRYKLRFDNSFIFSQEPEIIDVGAPIRTESDAFRNRARIDFTGQFTKLLGMEVGYQNTWYNYTQDADDVVDPTFNPDGAGSRSALLDRFEHLIHVDGRYTMRENTIGILGYQLGVTDYTSDDPLSTIGVPPFTGVGEGSDRNNISHYGYVGAEHSVSAKLSVSGKVGVQYVIYDETDDDSLGPYADIAGTYTYLPGSYIQAGFRYGRNATDIVGDASNPDNLTQDQESALVYAAIHHRITGQLSANVLGSYQHSTFQGGDADDSVDNTFLVGLNLEYQINRNWSAEAGYNFDRLDSDLVIGGVPRSYSRNRVYVGVRATY